MKQIPRRLLLRLVPVPLLLVVGLAGLMIYFHVTPRRQEVSTARALPSPQELEAHCRDHIGPARVETVAKGVHVAIGYDLANTILMETANGNVVVDLSSSPARARQVRQAFGERANRRVAAVIFTHSHIDHTGGATVWVEEGTQVWGTEAFEKHFFKQYGLFREAETARGGRQFGRHVPDEAIPCSALGPRPDIEAALETGFVMPTHVFSGKQVLEIGGVHLELHEAHGETHDQLFVWLPDRRILLPGDNYYRAFPNLYTIRGTSPRPVDDWIESLDRMRRLAPEILVPSHTIPVVGADAVRKELTTYRDGIQWVRDATVRGANAGRSVDELASTVGLPAHLRESPSLNELYGQVDWSVRAIYGNELGWFDGRAETLYPLSPSDEASRLLKLAGGQDAVWLEAERARDAKEWSWALRLSALLRGGGANGLPLAELDAECLRGMAEGVANTNGRAYLLESALERIQGEPAKDVPNLNDEFVDSIPLSLLFDIMAVRLEPELSIDTHETVEFTFPDANERWVLTVRRGVAEVVKGEALPGTPEPLARVKVNAPTWRRIAMGIRSPQDAATSGDLSVDGNLPGFLHFVRRFRRGV